MASAEKPASIDSSFAVFLIMDETVNEMSSMSSIFARGLGDELLRSSSLFPAFAREKMLCSLVWAKGGEKSNFVVETFQARMLPSGAEPGVG